jgi:hypothetical protein
MLSRMSFLYTNNAEYRELFRKITDQSPLPTPAFKADKDNDAADNHTADNHTADKDNDAADSDDEETRDETTYDEMRVSVFLDTVYANTRANPLFQQIYLAAAAKMITQNPEIGLAILMSYDYLWAFYPCYCAYIESPETFSEMNEWYMELSNRIR